MIYYIIINRVCQCRRNNFGYMLIQFNFPLDCFVNLCYTAKEEKIVSVKNERNFENNVESRNCRTLALVGRN